MVLGEDGVKGERAGPRAWFRDLDRLLSGELTGVGALRERGIGISPWRLSACIIILAMSYGLCMGMFAVFRKEGPSPMQVVASMIKVPLLFYLTLLVTLPSLYVFNALVGSRLTPSGVVRLLVASVGVNVTVLASLGPIVAFFSVCTTSYPFMHAVERGGLRRFGTFRIEVPAPDAPPLERRPDRRDRSEPSCSAGDLGRGRSGRTARAASAIAPSPSTSRRSSGSGSSSSGWSVPRWGGSFGLSSATPHMPFTWFRARESNFFMAVLQALARLVCLTGDRGRCHGNAWSGCCGSPTTSSEASGRLARRSRTRRLASFAGLRAADPRLRDALRRGDGDVRRIGRRAAVAGRLFRRQGALPDRRDLRTEPAQLLRHQHAPGPAERTSVAFCGP